MTKYVRWKGRVPADGLEYFEPTTARWVGCDRTMVGFWLKEGPVHMNPLHNPAILLLAETKAVRT
jgi:hypothetical protein